jgi:hypothetical protein
VAIKLYCIKFLIVTDVQYQGPIKFRGLVKCFIILLSFYGEELLAPRPTPKLEDHPLSAVHVYLFNIFSANFHIWRPFLHPQPEDAPCCGDRDPLGRPSRRWNDNIKMDLQVVGCGGTAWIELAQDKDRWRAVVNAVMSIRVP